MSGLVVSRNVWLRQGLEAKSVRVEAEALSLPGYFALSVVGAHSRIEIVEM